MAKRKAARRKAARKKKPAKKKAKKATIGAKWVVKMRDDGGKRRRVWERKHRGSYQVRLTDPSKPKKRAAKKKKPAKRKAKKRKVARKKPKRKAKRKRR